MKTHTAPSFHPLTRIAIAAALLAAPVASPAVDAIITDDTFSSAAQPTANFGTARVFRLRKGSNLYFRFDLSTLPAGTTGAQISKAVFRVWVNKVTKAGTFDLQAVTGSWTEETLKGNALPALGSVIVDAGPMAVTDQRQFIAFDITTLVRSWVDGGTANNGICLVPEGNLAIDAYIASKEDIGTGHLPELQINGSLISTSANSSNPVLPVSNTGTGTPVVGSNLAATGSTSGLVGTAASTSHGIGATGGVSGVVGQVTPTTPGGYSAGVRGINNGTSGTGIGVIGYQGGSGWGVYGETPGGFGVYGLTTNNSAASVGVRGETYSTNGIAVEAKYSGTGVGVALEVDNGAIRVSGVNKAAFVHTATPANKLSANGTDITNPMCDGDPNCLLFVTQKLNPSGIVYNNSPVGVYYNTVREKWEIFNQTNNAIPNNAQFNVLVIKQ